jgi:hypothetical protein
MKPQITPPLELIQEWACMLEHRSDADVFTKAAQWGADQELEACIEWIASQDWTWTKAQLFTARRPKPPTLKEQALKALWQVGSCEGIDNDTFETLRRALEALPND